MGRVKFKHLDNGLLSITHSSPTANGFICGAGALMGDEKERKGEVQALHTSEHMMYIVDSMLHTMEYAEGLEKKYIQSNGAAGFSSCYAYFYGPTKQRRFVVRALRDSLTRPYSKDAFIGEKVIIDDELRAKISGSNTRRLWDIMDSAMYPNTRYAITYSEKIAALASLTPGKVIDSRNRLFRPDNMAVVTIGTLPNRELHALAEEHFSDLKNPGVKKLEPYEPELPTRNSFTIFKELPLLETSYVMHTLRCGPATPRSIAITTVLEQILSGPEDFTESSLLFKHLRHIERKSYSQSTYSHVMRPELHLDIEYTTRFANTSACLQKVQDILDELSEKPVSSDRLRRFKYFAIKAFKENVLADDKELLDWYFDNASVGIHLKPQIFINDIKELTPHQIQRAVREWREGYGTVVLYSEKEQMM